MPDHRFPLMLRRLRWPTAAFGAALGVTLFDSFVLHRDGQEAPWWPLAGIALFLVLQRGWTIVPALLLGKGIGLAIAETPATALVALVPTEVLGAVVAAPLIRRAGVHREAFRTLRGAMAFFLLGPVTGGIVVALAALPGLMLDGHAVSPGVGFRRFVAGLLGILLLAPPLMMGVEVGWRSLLERKHRWPNLGAMAVAIGLGVAAFHPEGIGLAGAILAIPLILWCALTFGGLGTLLASAAFAMVATTLWPLGELSHGPLDLATLQILLSATGLAGLLVNGLATEREASHSSLREAHARLHTMLAQLTESRERMRRIFQVTPHAMTLTTLDEGRLVEANEGFTRMSGVPAGDAIGRTLEELGLQDDAVGRQRLVAQLLAEGEIKNREVTFRSATGEEIPTRLSARLVDFSGKPHILSIAEDIREQKAAEERLRRSEEQLQQAQKLEAIGTLASGIAHDFNNILTGIIAHAELARMDLPDGHPVRGSIEEVLAASRRAADLVGHILTFCRRGAVQSHAPMDVSPVIRETARFIRATTPSTIDLAVHVAPSLPEVNSDPTEIHQVLINLCTNAVQAMHGAGGRLEISAEAVRVGPETVAAHPQLQEGPHVRLGVRDTGAGIPPEVLPRIFDPFFTTKQPGEGTGLGLSVVHGIVQRHGGGIVVYSSVGKGTLFHVYLPAAPETAAPAADETPDEAPRGRGERVLVVDDDPNVLPVAGMVLRRLGYEVEAASHPDEALAIFAANPAGCDVLLTDQTMPGMTGLELAARLRAARPDLPVVLASGYLSNAELAATRALPVDCVLNKPLTFAETARAIAGALAARHSAPG